MFSKEYYIQLGVEDTGKYVLLTGTPKFVEKIAGLLEKSVFLVSNREFTSYAGYLEDCRVTIISTGTGGPSTAIVVEELHRLGVHTIVYVGTCSTLQPQIKNGSLIIPYGVVRGGGTAHEYLPPWYPAVPHPEVFQALLQCAQKSQNSVYVGITHAKDAFFREDPALMPDSEGVKNYWKVLRKANVLSSEMAGDTLFVIGSLRGIRAGAIFSAIGSAEGAPFAETGSDAAIQVGVDALRLLIRQDEDRRRAKKQDESQYATF